MEADYNWKKLILNQLSLRFILDLILIALSIFLLVYIVILKEIILSYSYSLNDILDKKYYVEIFENLEYAIFLFGIFLFLVRIFWDKIVELIKRLKLKWCVIILILIQSLIQILNLFFIKTIQHADAFHYLDHGLRLAETGKFLSPAGHYTAFWPVGVPLILALINKVGLPVVLTYNILSIVISAILIILFALVFKTILSDFELKLFLIIYTLSPNNILISQSILTEHLFLFFFILVFYLAISRSEKAKDLDFILIGLLIGFNILIRANALLIIPILIFFIYKVNVNVKKRILFLLVGVSIITSPWILRNYYRFDAFVISSANDGFIFLMGNHSNSSGKTNFNFKYDINNPNETEESKKAYQKALNDILKDPINFILRLPKKIFWSYWRGDFAITWALKETSNRILPLIKSFLFFATNLYFYLIIILSLLGLFFTNKEFIKKKEVWFFVLFYIFNLITIVIYVGSERYVHAVIPLHLLFTVKLISYTIKN